MEDLFQDRKSKPLEQSPFHLSFRAEPIDHLSKIVGRYKAEYLDIPGLRIYLDRRDYARKRVDRADIAIACGRIHVRGDRVDEPSSPTERKAFRVMSPDRLFYRKPVLGRSEERRVGKEGRSRW